MGLLQKACETYDTHAELVGIVKEGHEPLVPISHILTNAQIEITVNSDGAFQSARVVGKNEPKIIVPVTEASGGRSGKKPPPHPLCDKLCYIAPYNSQMHEPYVEQLGSWLRSVHSHPMLEPIYTYVKGGTVLHDLSESGVIKLNTQGVPKSENDLVRWRVLGLDLEQEACWLEKTLYDSFINWYQTQVNERTPALCMISGETAPPARLHPKGIIPRIPQGGNTKLISANDTKGFTYRGRFTEDKQAVTVSYLASQKAHNALRWVAAEQGTVLCGRAFLCWNPHGVPIPHPAFPLRLSNAPTAKKPSEYKEQLKDTLKGYQSKLPEEAGGVVIAAFDTSGTGRLSLTYYNELRGSDFLQRLHDWDDICCWYNNCYGIQSPSLYQIIQYAFGTLRGNQLTVNNRITRQQIQRLISCRVDCAKFPLDVEQAIVQRASNLSIYKNNIRKELLFVACSVIRKYRHDHLKEKYSMELELNKPDRSYQFGRLLAVLEKIERDTYSEEEEREPNAIRMLSTFSRRPLYASRIIWEHVNQAYLSKLKPTTRNYYRKLLCEIYEQISQASEAELNHSLTDTYLLGYFLQNKDLYTKKSTNLEDTEYEHLREQN